MIKNKKELMELIFRNLIIFGILLLILDSFSNLVVSQYIPLSLLKIMTFGSLFGFFLIFSEKNKQVESYLKQYSKYVFLAGLIFVAISSSTFEFLFTDLKEFLFSIQFYLILLTIGFGFYSFYFERDRMEKEIEKEQLHEEKVEKKKEKEFDKKFSRFKPPEKLSVGFQLKRLFRK
jgi:hypothetical protein